MIEITFENLLKKLKTYITNDSELEMISNAYFFAEKMHGSINQKRDSGESYIVHPLAVAFILCEMHADADTICAGLLHDVIEDTPVTKEEIAIRFNKTVANLVDGVTKIGKMNFSTKEEEKATNIRKLITSINEDVRIILIKLADRLHNMSTLQYRSEVKQKITALETMEIFVPLAYYTGAYKIKSQLEDLSLKFSDPTTYNDLSNRLEKIKQDTNPILERMLQEISHMLNKEEIHHSLVSRTKNIYGIYKQIAGGKNMIDMHDLLAIKIIVDNIKDCYLTLMHTHLKYPPVPGQIKDYIATPKPNMYSSLHTTVFGYDDYLFQIQIRTHEMDKIALYGLASYWDRYKENAALTMQEDFKSKFLFKSIVNLNSMAADNQDFITHLKEEILTDNIYTYTPKGDLIVLPKGSTAVDFAYQVHTELGNSMMAAMVNDEFVAPGYVLQNYDIVKIVPSPYALGPKKEWLGFTKTLTAQRSIRNFYNRIEKNG